MIDMEIVLNTINNNDSNNTYNDIYNKCALNSNNEYNCSY